LGLTAVALCATRADGWLDGRVVAAVVWVLAVVGWAAQRAFAEVAVPVSGGLLVVAVIAVLVRTARRRARLRGRTDAGNHRSGR
ncbi:hypothetical protein ACWGCP_09505, partial [Streptomyces niveus]